MIENLTNKYHFNLNRDIPYIKKKEINKQKNKTRQKQKSKHPIPPAIIYKCTIAPLRVLMNDANVSISLLSFEFSL